MEKKETQRKLALERRDTLLLKERLEYSLRIQQRLLALPVYARASTVLIYVAKGSEVGTAGIIHKLFDDKKRVVVPRVEGRQLGLYEIHSYDELQTGSFRILEPPTTSPVSHNEIDLAIIPLVAFDAACERIGYGKGYFDSLLPSMPALSIGLAFEEQKIHKVDVEPHDRRLDMILTESQIYYARK